jgi:hypothetical protein
MACSARGVNRKHSFNFPLMKFFLLAVLLLPLIVLCQPGQFNPKEEDPHKSEINKDIFRAFLSLATDTKFSFNANYEREIAKPFTLFVKGGPAIDRRYIATDAFGSKQYSWVLNAAASAELRWYFNLNNRIRRQKTTRNFSAAYISIEELLRSSPLIVINKNRDEIPAGSAAAFINIGLQKQHKKAWYNLFFGTRFPGRVYENSVTGFDLLHAGISIGKVF